MNLQQKIDADLKQAMLHKDEDRKNTLRVIKADRMLREVELGRPLTDEELTALLQKSVKSRRDALEQYRASGRDDIVQKEEAELAIILSYLPKELTEDEVRGLISAIASELGLAGKKDLGRLMKELKTRAPTVDGKLASKIGGEVLG